MIHGSLRQPLVYIIFHVSCLIFSPFSIANFMLGVEWSNVLFEGPRLVFFCHCWWCPWYGVTECYKVCIGWMGKTINVHGFPSLVTADIVREFLEQRTGRDTVYAIKVRQDKRGVRSFAIVQFKNARYAELIISLASQRNLWYGRSYLTARTVEHDIIQRPRTLSHSMEGIALHFGCQVSAKRFSTLWKGVNVSVNFGIGPRKFCFLLSYYNTEYKLELPYENVWQIELHRATGHVTMHLVIQVSWLIQIVRDWFILLC